MSGKRQANHVSINIFDLIDSICKEFRRQWKAGNRPRIESYLDKVPEEARHNLFRNLLQAEIRSRRQGSDSPSSDEYINRFPVFRRVIRQAFDEPTMLSIDDQAIAQSEGGAAVTATIDMPAANRIGEYELIGELGRGGFGVVYEAKHIERGNRVALKTLPTGVDGQEVNAERLHRFRKEFRSLSEINHSNLVGMQTLEVDGSQWFFTMDLIDGEDFLSYVRPNDQLDEVRLRESLGQLVTGIAALHQKRILHRDLKPSNVQVGRDGCVTILDFGLVAELRERSDQTASMQTRNFVGTPRYAAPEQVFGQRFPTTDWYAMGTMLYEALTGEPPFRGTQAELLVRKQNEDAPMLVDREDLPTDLRKLTDRLLTRDPGNRPDAVAIAKTLAIELASPTQGGTSTRDDDTEVVDLPAEEQETVLIGREKQLADLERARQQWEVSDHPVVVFVSGRSGEGKTALIDHFLDPLRRSNRALVLTGKCYDRESVPYKAIDGLIDSLVGYMRSLSDEEVKGLIPNDTDMLARLFPVTRRVAEIGNLDLTLLKRLDAKQIRFRAFNALKELLARISRTTPFVMFIDDLQWGDNDSASVLSQLLSPPNQPDVLLLGSFRSDESENSEFLSQWKPLSNWTAKQSSSESPGFSQHEVSVGPLSVAECEQLVLTRIGHDSPAIRARAVEIHQSTAGNPYLIDQVIEGLDPETGALNSLPLDAVIENRLSRLPIDARRLLDVIAVSGHAIVQHEAAEAAEVGETAFSILNRMRNERLVRLIGTGQGNQVDTYHDKIRETVLERIDETRRRNYHRSIGETIERIDEIPIDDLLNSIEAGSDSQAPATETPARVHDLARHFEAGGIETKGLAYSLLAAEFAKQQYALELSIRNFQNALSLAARRTSAVKYRVMIGLGTTQLLAGQYQEARDSLDSAVGLAGNEFERLSAVAPQADIAYKSGSLLDSISVSERVLTQLGVRVPQSSFGLVRAILAIKLRRITKNLFPKRRTDELDTWRRSIAIRVLHLLTYPCWFRDPIRSLWASYTGYELASQSADQSLRCLLASVTGTSEAFILCRQLSAMRYNDEAFELASELNDRALETQSIYLRAGALVCVESFHEAEALVRRTIDVYHDLGDAWRISYCQFVLASAVSRLGDVNESVKAASQGFMTATKFAQFRSAQSAIEPWAMVTDGNFPFDQLRQRFQQVSDDLFSNTTLHVAESLWHRYHSRFEASLEAAEKASHSLEEYWPVAGVPWPVPNSIPCLAIVNHAHALRVLAKSVRESDPPRSRSLSVRALRKAKRAVRVERFAKVNRAYALRELALAYGDIGKSAKAYNYVQQSLRVAQNQGAKQQYAKSLLVSGQFGEKLGKPDAPQKIEEAQRKLDEFDRQIEEANQIAMKNLGLTEASNGTSPSESSR